VTFHTGAADGANSTLAAAACPPPRPGQGRPGPAPPPAAVRPAAQRGGMAAGGAAERGGLEAAVRGRLRGLRERWAWGSRERGAAAAEPGPADGGEEAAEEVSALQALPVSESLLPLWRYAEPRNGAVCGDSPKFLAAAGKDSVVPRPSATGSGDNSPRCAALASYSPSAPLGFVGLPER